MLSTKTTFSTVKEIKVLAPAFPYLIWSSDENGGGNYGLEMSFKDLQVKNPTWSAKDMVYGLQRLLDIAQSGQEYLFDVYTKDEIKKNPAKEHVKLFYFPSTSERFVILAAGGAYGAVCSLAESFPVASRLNELGVTVFCLNYRVGPPKLFPKPMEDLASAYQFIKKNAAKFRINAEKYAVGGFSAGGHLAASWGTKELGYRKYKLPAPEIMLLSYPLIAVWKTIALLPEPISEIMLGGYLGKGYTKIQCQPYDIDENIDAKYPKVFIIHAEDDTTVPIWNAKDMVKVLKEHQILHRFEHPQTGGHGYGLGSDTKAEGWVDRAVEFWGNT